MTLDLAGVFEKFGLPVSFLIIMIWLFVKSDEKFSEERKEHRDERLDWKKSQERLQTDTNNALKDLTKAISDMSNRH